MDSLITAAARALAAGDPLGALNRVALREDASALALRGILDAVNVGGECAIEEGLEYESAQFGLMFSTQDMREGTSAFLERRKPEFRNC